MIRHIVFFSLKDRADLDGVLAKLSRLSEIPGSTCFEVRANSRVDQFGNDIDIVVYGEFPSLEALAAYKRHPIYDAVTRAVRPLRELRFAADVYSSQD